MIWKPEISPAEFDLVRIYRISCLSLPRPHYEAHFTGFSDQISVEVQIRATMEGVLYQVDRVVLGSLWFPGRKEAWFPGRKEALVRRIVEEKWLGLNLRLWQPTWQFEKYFYTWAQNFSLEKQLR